MAFNSNQLLFKTEQLLEIIPWTERGLYRLIQECIKNKVDVREIGLYRLIQECIKNKVDVREIGLYRFEGIRSDMWNPQKLVDYLIKNKLDKKVHYNH